MLVEMSSCELSGWLAYLEIDDEQTMYRMAKALSLVFAQKGQAEEEEVIDTTEPSFAQTFKGFTGKGNEIKYG